jgi:glycosyltransferase involved in cell wall biosynthesis
LGKTNGPSKAGSKHKLAVVVTHPIQHFAPVYQQISKRARLDIVAIYLTDAGAKAYHDKDFGGTFAWDVDLLSGYRHQFLRPGLGAVPSGFFEADSPDLPEALSAENPDAVLIYGYARRISWRARSWARSNRKCLLYASDSVLLRRRARWRLLLKSVVVRRFFRRVDIFLSAGDRNEEYLGHYGAPSRRMRRCPLPVDLARLRAAGPSDLKAFRRQARVSLGFTDTDFVALQCGKLQPIKRPMDLMAAVARLRGEGLPVTGLFAGSGVLMEEMKAYARSCQFPDAFRLAGFVNQSSLPTYYAASDLLVIPSSEDAHPLVATEAAAFGLPLVVSDQVGCVGLTDVARPFENTEVFPVGDVGVLQSTLRRLIETPTRMQAMREASLRIASTQDTSVAAAAIEDAVLESCA